MICDGCGINNKNYTEVIMKSINSTRLLKGNETTILCNGCYETDSSEDFLRLEK